MGERCSPYYISSCRPRRSALQFIFSWPTIKVGPTEQVYAALNLSRVGFDELPAEAAFDAEMAVRHLVIHWRCDFDDLAVLGGHGQRAATPAMAADRIRLVLA